MNQSCFFIGHREAGEDVRPLLDEAVERHIAQYGVTQFIVGEHGSFDRMAAGTVLNAKQRHTEITLLLLLAYHPAEHKINLPQGFDGTYYPFARILFAMQRNGAQRAKQSPRMLSPLKKSSCCSPSFP